MIYNLYFFISGQDLYEYRSILYFLLLKIYPFGGKMEKTVENANFQSKLKELATFAEAILQGTNESYKKELLSEVGHLILTFHLGNWDFPAKKPKKKM